MPRVTLACAPAPRLVPGAGRLSVALFAALALSASRAEAQPAPDAGEARPAPSDAGLADPAVDGGGGAPVPPPRCYAIDFGGGCCLQDRSVFEWPCPAGFAPEDECFSVRNFCPSDPIDAGPPPDAGFPADARTSDAGLVDSGAPLLRCHQTPAGGCCLSTGSIQRASCPAGWVEAAECMMDRGFCAIDFVDAGPGDTGSSSADAGGGSGGTGGALPEADASCGCAATPRRSASTPGGLLALGLALMLARRRR